MEFEEYKKNRIAREAVQDITPKDQSKRHSHLEAHPPRKVFYKGMLYKVYIYAGDLTWKCQLEGGAHEALLHESEFTIAEGCPCQLCWQKETARLRVS